MPIAEEIIKGRYSAWRVELPPPEQRPNPDTVASLDRWILHLPGQHPFWSYYVIFLCHLRDEPGTTPAIRHFPEASHELSVFAIDPEWPLQKLRQGGVLILQPANYVRQFAIATDDGANRVVKAVVGLCLVGRLIPEMQGLRGMRERWDSTIDELTG